jgi:serine/threonine protein phosphatase PrpC
MFRNHHATAIGFEKNVNQDSHEIYETSKYLISIVTDGLGSSKYSDRGSFQATKAVRKAITQWRSLNDSNSSVLLQLIHFYWNLFINDLNLEKKDCSTTCLFVYIDKENSKGLIAQLGDGMIYFKSNDYTYITPPSDDFNYTKSLGSSKSVKDWVINSIKLDKDNFSFFIATDGISDDIVKNKEKEFISYLIDRMNKLEKKSCNNFLRKTLKNWSTKFHKDDKTICITWSEK